MPIARLRSVLVVLVMFTLVVAPAMAQQRPNLANWALAEKFETDNLRDVVFSTTASARFINETDSLWYNWRDPKGAAFWLVLPQSRTKQPLFDHPAMAAQLSSLHRKP